MLPRTPLILLNLLILSGLGDARSDVSIGLKTMSCIGWEEAELNKPKVISLGKRMCDLLSDIGIAAADLNDCFRELRLMCSVESTEFLDPFRNGKRHWKLAFRATAHNKIAVYPAYMNGTGIPQDVETGCMQFDPRLPCTNHYRNNVAIDNWRNVSQVLLGFFVKGKMVKYVRFNGMGSSWDNWFKADRIMDSSWSDLKTKKHNVFSILGETDPGAHRRFYANNLYHRCPGDKGWFLASDSNPVKCKWERRSSFPALLFSRGDTVTTWSKTSTVGSADAMGIFIRYI